MKRYVVAVLALIASPACAQKVTDGLTLPPRAGCIYFFPKGLIAPSDFTVKDALTNAVIFSAKSGDVNPSDLCVAPTLGGFTWFDN